MKLKKLKKWLRRNKVSVSQMHFGYGDIRRKKDKRINRHLGNYPNLKEPEDLATPNDSGTLIITFHVDAYTLNWFNKQVKEKKYKSRSEAIRLALREFILNEEDYLKYLESKRTYVY